MMLSHLAMPRKGHLDQVLIYLLTYASTTTPSWFMTLVTRLWNKMFLNEETGHPLSLALCKGRKRSHLTCQSLEDWDL